MMTRIYMITFVAIVAVLAVAVSPITTAFAQSSSDGNGPQTHSEDKTYDDKDDKSCPGKYKGEMST
jgi:hypothetical protein